MNILIPLVLTLLFLLLAVASKTGGNFLEKRISSASLSETAKSICDFFADLFFALVWVMLYYFTSHTFVVTSMSLIFGSVFIIQAYVVYATVCDYYDDVTEYFWDRRWFYDQFYQC